MFSPKVFVTESHSATLIVTPLANITSFADENVQPELDRVLAELAEPGRTNVVMDFGKLAYFGSVTLAATQMIWKRVRAAQGKMVICNVSEVGREVLRVSKFDQIWQVYPSRQEALTAIAG